MSANTDSFLQLLVEASDLWNDRKELDFVTKKQRKRILANLEKKVQKIKAIVDGFDKEFELLKELYQSQ